MTIKQKVAKKILTYDHRSKENGWILELNSDKDGWTEFIKGQVYLTVVKPKKQKGFHLHKLKTNHLTCIKGLVTIGVFDGKSIQSFEIGEDNLKTIKIQPNLPLSIYNRGKENAYIVNYCYPAYEPKVKEQEEVDIEWHPDASN